MLIERPVYEKPQFSGVFVIGRMVFRTVNQQIQATSLND